MQATTSLSRINSILEIIHISEQVDSFMQSYITKIDDYRG